MYVDKKTTAHDMVSQKSNSEFSRICKPIKMSRFVLEDNNTINRLAVLLQLKKYATDSIAKPNYDSRCLGFVL